ncbi:hypothetical protein BT69DRAFT_1275639 [Atractiella rhizophila]|nr:hypothetical protein BT69DRAFT_1275639 [Atractiella rhizophila]
MSGRKSDVERGLEAGCRVVGRVCDKRMSEGRVALSSHLCSDSLAISHPAMPLPCFMPLLSPTSSCIFHPTRARTPWLTFHWRLLRDIKVNNEIPDEERGVQWGQCWIMAKRGCLDLFHPTSS